MSDPSSLAELRARLAAAGARPTEDELSHLLPVLERRLAGWERLKSEPLGEVPPSFTFVPPA